MTDSNSYITSMREIVALSLLGVAGNISPFVLPVIVGALVDHVGLSIQQSSYVASADMFGLGFGTLIWSRYIARSSWRKFAFLSAVMLFLGNLVCAFASTFELAAVSRFIAGTGGGLMLAIGVSGLSNTKKPDRVVAIYMLLVTAVATVVLYAFPFLLIESGSKGMFLAMAGFACIAGVSSFFVPAKSVSGKTGSQQTNAESEGVSHSVRLMAVSGVLTSFFGLSLFWVYFERVGVAAGFVTAQISTGLSTAQFMGAIGAIAAAILSTKVGRMIPVMLALGLSLMASTAIPTITGFSYYLIAASVIIFCWNGFYPYVIGILISLDATAKLVTYGLVMMTLGKSLSPVIGAFFVTETDYSMAYWICAAAFIVSAVLFYPAIKITDTKYSWRKRMVECS